MIRTMFAVGVFLMLPFLPNQEPDTQIQFDDHVFGGPTGLSSYAGGNQYSTSLPETPTGPIWKTEQDHPPISAAEAIRKAIAKRKELVKDDDDFRWGLVSASLIPWEYEDGYWYWLVTSELHIRQGGSSGIPSDISLVVLMDGTVINPKVRKWDR